MQQIEKLLNNYKIPYLNESLVQTRKLKITENDTAIHLQLKLGFPCESDMDRIRQELIQQLNHTEKEVAINFDTTIASHLPLSALPPLPNIKNVIVVGSGKGGVGKSTVAVNIAISLAQEGAKVGLLDADIYGPSQPLMLGTLETKPHVENKKIHPVNVHGLSTMSIGYLTERKAAMVWRGPMLGKAIEQLISDTDWPDLDYLIIDLPPGTGDIQLSLCQKIPINGAVIVTTPQSVALVDVVRACEMFNKLNVPLLGVVENMTNFTCRQCGHVEHLFGEGAAETLSKEYQLPVLARIPLHYDILQNSDRGESLQQSNPTLAMPFMIAAKKAAAQISLQKINYRNKFPKIIVKQDNDRGSMDEHKV